MNIKLYHISNTKQLFALLAKCKGNVAIVDEDGRHINMREGGNLSAISAACSKGIIDELNLFMSDQDDIAVMLRYMA